MNNPLVVELPEWRWVNVADNVTDGAISQIDTGKEYYQTYRIAGDQPPADVTRGNVPKEGVRMFVSGNQEEISSTDAIDIYVMCRDGNNSSDLSGIVRVDL